MQISDDLIKYITGELMKRLAGGLPVPSPAARPLLHLVGRREDLSTPALMRLQENFEIFEHRLWEDELPREACALITSLGIQPLVRVAEGDEGCTVEGRVLLAALLNGQSVCALRDGLVWRRYLNTAPKGLLSRYGHYESLLQGYGLKIVGENEVVEALLGRGRPARAPAAFMPAAPLPEPAPAFSRSPGGRRVWSESEVMSACPASGGLGQTLNISRGDIMTPLARDYVLAMKINLIKG